MGSIIALHIPMQAGEREIEYVRTLSTHAKIMHIQYRESISVTGAHILVFNAPIHFLPRHEPISPHTYAHAATPTAVH